MMLRILPLLFLLLLLTAVFFCCEGLPLVMNQSCHTHTFAYRKVEYHILDYESTLFHKQHTHTQVLVLAACPPEVPRTTPLARMPSNTGSHQDPGPGAWDGNRHLNTIGSWRPGCFLAVCFSEGRGLACSIRHSFPVSSDPFSLHSLPG